jgi:hypothetical protein
MSPDIDKLKLTASYQRGEKLEEATGLSEDQEVVGRAQGVVRMEEIINNCLERAGNEPLEFPTDCAPAFRQKIVLSVAQKMLFGELDQAWKRQIPELQFPIRISEKTRPLVRRRNGEWEETQGHELWHLSGWSVIEEGEGA